MSNGNGFPLSFLALNGCRHFLDLLLAYKVNTRFAPQLNRHDNASNSKVKAQFYHRCKSSIKLRHFSMKSRKNNFVLCGDLSSVVTNGTKTAK